MALLSIIRVGLLGVGLAACGSTVDVRNPVAEPPLVEPVDLALAVFYVPRLETYACIVNKGYLSAEWTIRIGAPSIAMFNTILRSKFRMVELLREDPRTRSAPSGKRSVVLELASFDGCEASWPIIGTTRMSIAYRARFSRADGGTVDEFTARGRSGSGDARPGDEGMHLTSLTEAAMRRAAADFIVQMEKSEKIGHWFRNAN